MKIVKYTCDCCGKEVKGENALTKAVIYSEFKDIQNDPSPYDTIEICRNCKLKIQRVIANKFYEIKNSR